MDRLRTRAKLLPKPGWCSLYAGAALGLVPFALTATLVPEGAVRTALEVVAALALSAVLALWVRVNRIAIELQGGRGAGWRRATVTVAAQAPADLCPPERPDPNQRRERAARPGQHPGRKGSRPCTLRHGAPWLTSASPVP